MDYTPAQTASLSLLVCLSELCKKRGVPTVPGELTSFPPTAAVIECDAELFSQDNCEKAFDLAAPTLVVLQADVVDGALVERAWVVGEKMVFWWDASPQEPEEPDDDEGGDQEKLAALGRRLAEDPIFARAASAPERQHAAQQWLSTVGFTPDGPQLREIARIAQVVREFEIMPGQVSALLAGGASASEIAAQLSIGITKARRLIAQVK